MRASGATVVIVECLLCGGPAHYKFAKMVKVPLCFGCKRTMNNARSVYYKRQQVLAKSETVTLQNKRRGLAMSFAEHRAWMDKNGLGHLFEPLKRSRHAI